MKRIGEKANKQKPLCVETGEVELTIKKFKSKKAPDDEGGEMN